MSADDDFRNREIIINDMSPPVSKGSESNETHPIKSVFKNTYKNLVNNIKNLAKKGITNKSKSIHEPEQ